MDEGASAALAHRLAPELVASPAASERPITVDQTNVSVVVDEVAVVKWLRPPVPEPHRAVTIASHLRDVGFAETPSFFGAEVVDGVVVATVSAYLAGATDGWEWYVDQLTDELLTGGSCGSTRSVGVAARLGGLAARLHVALAAPSRHLPLPVGWGDAADEHGRALAVLAAALDVSTGSAGAILRERADRIRTCIDSMAKVGPIDVQHIHGDLHVGQILRRGDTMAVTDFDGNPLETVAPAGSTALRSPMVDLASLVQSIDHVGRVVAHRRPELTPCVEEFIADATSAAVTAYSKLAPVEHRLLDGLRTAQELHELVYAATHLPRWSYVPEATLTAMYP